MKDDISKSLKDLNLTNEEVKKFDKAFKDPKFVKLFDDYLAEISTPQAKEEQELYLRQLENEGKSESIYGKGVQLLVPEPGCVVKTREKRTGEKVFINICTSEKIEVAKSKRAVNSLGQRGLNWDIPSTIGKSRTGKDKRGQQCRNVDYVVHPMTLQMAEKNAGFKHLIVETAIDKFEETEGLKLDRNFSCPRMKYHGINGMDRPSVLGMRTGEGGAVENGLLQPQANNELDKKLVTAQSKNEADSQDSRSKFAFKEASPKGPVPQNPKDPGFTHPSGEKTPQYKLVESGCIDLADAWEDVGRGIQKPLSYPKNLSLRISLPGISSVSEAELDVTELGVSLVVPGRYRLELCLPYPVDFAKGRAKFVKASKTLNIDLPTVPPSPPQKSVNPPSLESSEDQPHIVPASIATPNERQGDQIPSQTFEGQGAEEKDERERECQELSPSIGECSSDAKPLAQDSEFGVDGQTCEGADKLNETSFDSEKGSRGSDLCSNSIVEDLSGSHPPQELTENQRKWMELHTSQAEVSQPECETSGVKDGAHQDENTAPKETLPGKSEGEASSSGGLAKSSKSSGSEQAKAAISGVESGLSTTDEKEKTRAARPSVEGPRMRPRISRTVAEELD